MILRSKHVGAILDVLMQKFYVCELVGLLIKVPYKFLNGRGAGRNILTNTYEIGVRSNYYSLNLNEPRASWNTNRTIRVVKSAVCMLAFYISHLITRQTL